MQRAVLVHSIYVLFLGMNRVLKKWWNLKMLIHAI